MTVTKPATPLRGIENLSEAWRAFVRPRPAVALAWPTRLQIGVWASLLCLTTALTLTNLHAFQLGAYQDDADYVLLARGLVYANAYGFTNVPSGLQTTHYPFGYPLLLAAVERALPGNVDAMRLLSLAATLLTMSLMFWGWPLLSHSTSYWWALAVTAMCAFSPLTVGHARLIMAEAVFTSVAVGAWLLAEWLQGREAASPWALALGVLLALAISMRAIGLIFLVAIFLRQGLAFGRRAWRMIALTCLGLALTIVATVAVTPVSLKDIFSGSTLYLNDYTGFVQGTQRLPSQVGVPYGLLIIQRGYKHVAHDVRDIILPVGDGNQGRQLATALSLPFLRDVAGWVIGLAILIGGGRWLRREGANVFWLSAALYYLVIAFWDWAGTRLLYPIQFQLCLAFLLGCDWLIGKVRQRWAGPAWAKLAQPILLTGLVCVLGAASVLKTLQIDDSRNHTGDLAVNTAWVAAHAAPDDIVVSEQPRIDYLYGQRPTLGFPALANSPEAVAVFLAQQHVRYVIIAPILRWQTPYTPAYSQQSAALKAALDQLALEKQVEQVNVAADGWVVTYRSLLP